MSRRAIAVLFAGLAVATSLASAVEPQRYASELGTLRLEEVAVGLENPWSLAFLPDQKRLLVTERPGRLRLVGLDGSLSALLAGVPEVYDRGQGGLLDVQLSPEFQRDRLVYLSYAE